MRDIRCILLVFFICLSANVTLFSQLKLEKAFRVHKLSGSIDIDGKLDEKIWDSLTKAEDFWQYFPSDSILALDRTEVSMMYDDTHLYIGAKCFSQSQDYIVPSYRRDFRAGGNDNLTFLLDTYGDGNTCFWFGTNPLGVQREGLIVNGGQRFQDFSASWDNKWECEASIEDGYWSLEMKIPLNIIRFKEGDVWRFNAYRFNMDRNETSTWTNIPQNQTIFSLAFMGDMKWDETPKSSSLSLGLIPYATARVSKDYENNTDAESSMGYGADVKVPIGSGLNLDLTYNPDFSQVEVDRQVTNLDRFEIFFPERRQFFLENADLFSSFGFSNSNPFFSRRIGVATDTTDDVTIENSILAGARLSGKLNRDWRVGLLNMQTAEDANNALPSFNYGVLAVQRKLWSRSNVGFIFVNKQAVGEEHENYIDPYNRVLGVDLNFASEDNTWSGKTYVHASHNFETSRHPFSQGFLASYNSLRHNLSFRQQWVSSDFDAQVGFVRRKDFVSIEPEYQRRFFYSSGPFQRLVFGLRPLFIYKPNFGKTDHAINFSINGRLGPVEFVDLNLTHQFVYLFDDFDPTRTDQTKLPADTEYSFWSLRVRYNSDRRKPINFRVEPTLGQYFNGYRYGLNTSINFRYQPFGELALNANYNIFDLEHLDSRVSTLLIGPRIDVTFSKSVFLTTFIQYNSQSKNTNVNSRLQWRFAPVSDFFVVYTDNYFTGSTDVSDRFLLNIRNRALVVKFTYWLNT